MTRTHIASIIFFAIGLRHLGYTACNVYCPPPSHLIGPLPISLLEDTR